jgi:hypothetical protein
VKCSPIGSRCHSEGATVIHGKANYDHDVHHSKETDRWDVLLKDTNLNELYFVD